MNTYKCRVSTVLLHRRVGPALLALVLTLHAVPLLAQADRASVYLGLGLSRTPLNSATAGTSVQLTDDADRSPFPSFIDYPAEDASSTWMVGLTAGYRPLRSAGVAWRAQLETSYVYSALTDNGPSLDITTLELGVGYFYPVGTTVGVELGLAALGGLATGQVGTVGSRQGDVYLIAPDDSERYESGSEIWTLGYGLGANATVTAHIGPAALTAGYRLATPIDSWSYRVRDVDDSSRSSKLPARGFRSNPPTYDLDGAFVRLGIAISLTSPSRQKVPPTVSAPPQDAAPTPPDSDFQPEASEQANPAERDGAAEAQERPRVPPAGAQRILWVQERLNSQGYDCGPEDGIMGQRTRGCIRALQRSWNLPVTSELDDATLDVIRDL